MKALLSVSFGTSHEDTRVRTIDAIDARLAEAFPDRAFYAAWTSGRIVAKVRAERGEQHDTLEEAFARLSAAGVDDLLVATSCLMQGHEMSKIAAAADEWAQEGEGRVVRVARPLLADAADRAAMARAIGAEFSAMPADAALVLMGHGMKRSLRGNDAGGSDPNAVYSQIQDELSALGHERFFVGTVEGTPTFEDVAALVEAAGVSHVVLAPFMIVAGDHAKNDLAGDDPDSWKSKFEARGLVVDAVLRGLGEYPAVHEIVCEHALEAIAE